MYGMHCYIICQRERLELNIHDTVFRSLLLKHGWKNVFLTQEHCERFLTLWFPWCPCRISPKLCMAFLGLWSIKKKSVSRFFKIWLFICFMLAFIEMNRNLLHLLYVFRVLCLGDVQSRWGSLWGSGTWEKHQFFLIQTIFLGACTFLVKDFFFFLLPVLH